MRRLAGLCLIFCVLFASTAACSGSGARVPSAQREKIRAENAELDSLKSRIKPDVWAVIELQSWYADKGNRDDGLRLVRYLAKPNPNTTAAYSKQLIGFYPAGLSADVQAFIDEFSPGDNRMLLRAWVKDGISPMEQQLTAQAVAQKISFDILGLFFTRVEAQSWAKDGYSDSEIAGELKSALIGTYGGTQAVTTLLNALGEPWLQDGLDESEAAVFEAASLLLYGGYTSDANDLLAALRQHTYDFSTLVLPLSGQRNVILFAAPGLTAQMPRLKTLARTWLPTLEAFVGPYRANSIILSVDPSVSSNCGTASRQITSIGEVVPSIVSFTAACVVPPIIVHEMTHSFVGGGPTWFTEGIADAVAYHLTGTRTSYLVATSTGKIDLNGKLTPSAVGPYLNQGSLGAKLLVDIQQIVGAEAMSNAIKEIAADPFRDGQYLLDVFIKHAGPERAPRVRTLIASRVNTP